MLFCFDIPLLVILLNQPCFKKIDQMKWVGLMNNVMSTAEEIVMKEMIII